MWQLKVTLPEELQSDANDGIIETFEKVHTYVAPSEFPSYPVVIPLIIRALAEDLGLHPGGKVYLYTIAKFTTIRPTNCEWVLTSGYFENTIVLRVNFKEVEMS